MKRNSLPVLLIAVLLTVAFFSCSKSSSNNTKVIGTSYLPLIKGQYVTYQVDSIYWIDTSCLQIDYSYQLQYILKDTFTDAHKNIQYVYYSYMKSNKTKGIWTPNDVFYASVSDTGIIFTKDELRFIKFGYPIQAGTKWNGNALIDTRDADFSYFANWTYAYQNVAEPYFNGVLDFQNTITVLENDQAINDIVSMPDTTSNRTFFKEIYAQNVGLVYSEATHWTYDPQLALCRKGYSVVMKAIDHN